MRNSPKVSRPYGLEARTGKISSLVIAMVLMVGISGCSWFQFPGVYRLSIPQGNIVTQDMVDQLKPGMTRRQVRFVLGTPLIQDSFNQDRWDYVNTFRDPKGEITRSRFTVYFEGDLLTHFAGDYLPSSNPENATVETTVTEEEEDEIDTEIPGPEIFEATNR